MVKCSRCGVDVDDSFETCPNCGNNLAESQTPDKSLCSNCGQPLNEDAEFCSGCGEKVRQITSGRCESCGADIPEGVLFCSTCGAKVNQPPKSLPVRTCGNCGFKLDEDTEFCPECGTNLRTGEKPDLTLANQNFTDKININSIVKPTVVSLTVAVVLSVIGVLIGFSWVSFIIAIVLSVGFFAGLIDNEANAVLSGFFVGLILGFLESPIIEFCWGAFAARVYEWFFGSQIILLIIIAVITAYVSNVFLKSKIQDIAQDRFSWL